MFSWYRQVTAKERKTFWACFSGWALDALDVQMFSLAIPALIAAFSLSKADAGMISGATLVASAIGGWFAGALSDRYGRQDPADHHHLVFLLHLPERLRPELSAAAGPQGLQGFGFGGEWAAGAVLMAETIRAEHRGRAMGTVQAPGPSAGAVRCCCSRCFHDAAAGNGLARDVRHRPAARTAGGLRAPLGARDRCLPGRPQGRVAGKPAASTLLGIFRPDVLRLTLIGSLLGVGAHGGYYALMTWLPLT
jgi:hypothetical protein